MTLEERVDAHDRILAVELPKIFKAIRDSLELHRERFDQIEERLERIETFLRDTHPHPNGTS